jgi:hypothetical protein
MASHVDIAFFLSLTLATSLAFIVLGSYRLWTLRHESVKVKPNWLAVIKPVGITPCCVFLVDTPPLTECCETTARSFDSTSDIAC